MREVCVCDYRQSLGHALHCPAQEETGGWNRSPPEQGFQSRCRAPLRGLTQGRGRGWAGRRQRFYCRCKAERFLAPESGLTETYRLTLALLENKLAIRKSLSRKEAPHFRGTMHKGAGPDCTLAPAAWS